MRRILATTGMLIAAATLPGAAAHAQAAQGIVVGNVNLWSGPGSDYPRVSALPAGVAVTVAGCVDGWSWCDVAYADARGWVPGEAITVEREGRQLPVRGHGAELAIPIVTYSLASYWDEHYRTRPWYADRDRWAGQGGQRVASPPSPAPSPPVPAAPPPVAEAPQPIAGYVTTGVNLRAGPSVAYPRVTTLPAGAPIGIFGCVEGWTWCDVVYGGLRGWIAGNYVSSLEEGRPVIVQQAGPRLPVPIVTFAVGPYWDSYYRGWPWYRDRARWVGAPHYVAPWPRRTYRPPYYHHPRYYQRWDHRWDRRGRRY
ncbi:MAG: SH3 domain-containing protein [Alphaproteobacteria bacterium]|nr:SH3 domain-containing protein [Alphaproteobacteria bacterium]